MSRMRDASSSADSCFPRVSGDEPFTWALANLMVKFSPSERG